MRGVAPCYNCKNHLWNIPLVPGSRVPVPTGWVWLVRRFYFCPFCGVMIGNMHEPFPTTMEIPATMEVYAKASNRQGLSGAFIEPCQVAMSS